jgi:AraC family transcriptional regulator
MLNQQSSRINDVIYFIHRDISASLPAAELAQVAAYSEQHFHRVFKSIVGESVHCYIRRVRLEFAANQLMFDVQASVQSVAIHCGFNSVSSFSKAFKATFGMSPGRWRRERNQLEIPAKDVEKCAPVIDFSYEIRELPARRVAYVRHQGYDRSIKKAWQKLIAWASAQGMDYSQQFGLLHSNPALVPLKDCRYVACIETSDSVFARGPVNVLQINAGLHAVFKLAGRYGDLLVQLENILAYWIPASGLKMLPTPIYVHYYKNHFIANDERYEIDLCLPISFY